MESQRKQGSSFELPIWEWRGNEGDNGTCIIGNIASRKWCEVPKSRAKPGDPGYKEQTQVPPFHYDESNGKCEMTPAYCEHFGISWDPQKKECYVPPGQKFVEDFLTGQTIFRGIKKLL